MNTTRLISNVCAVFEQVGMVWSDSVEFRVGALILLLQFTSMLFITLLVSISLNRPQVCYFSSSERPSPYSSGKVD